MSDDEMVEGLRLPRSVVDDMREALRSIDQFADGPTRSRWVEWARALVEHNPEPIKVGDWVKPRQSGEPMLVIAVQSTLVRDWCVLIGNFDAYGRWKVNEVSRCGPHPDPVIRSRILKAAGR